MPGRKYQQGTSSYRYGFNGKEQDKEVAGTTTYDYGFRIYNPALGKFLSVDPLSKEYPWNSPYAFAENDVIRSIDLDGLEKLIVIEYYDAANNKTKAVFTGMRDSKTKAAVNMNMKSALNIKLTTQDVYIIRYNSKGKIFFEGPGGTLDNYYRKIISKAPRDEGENDESLPDNTMQQTEVTTRGRFIKSDLISNIENEFFEKEISFSIPKPKIHDLNQKKVAETLGGIAYLGGTDVLPGSTYDGKYKDGGIPNGYIDLKHSGLKALSNLLKDIKNDGTIKGVDLSVTFMVGEPSKDEMSSINRGLQFIKSQLTQMFKNAGVNNININLSTTSNISQSNSSLQLKK